MYIIWGSGHSAVLLVSRNVWFWWSNMYNKAAVVHPVHGTRWKIHKIGSTKSTTKYNKNKHSADLKHSIGNPCSIHLALALLNLILNTLPYPYPKEMRPKPTCSDKIGRSITSREVRNAPVNQGLNFAVSSEYGASTLKVNISRTAYFFPIKFSHEKVLILKNGMN